ncbi:MAG: 50S ribosomal protein L4 [Gemmatimonadota bacterium]|nr:MAG: 50S ribosomal protein L4 [Gemmatimonadota bacterium]
MATANAFSANGDKTGTVDLPADVFGIEPNSHVVWEAVVNFQANQRQGTVKTKTRGEVNRSNSKPWRQKGTGRARAGTFRSPLWVGGGTMFGPQPRDHSYKLPKKIRRLALRSALSDRANEGRVVVIDEFAPAEPKTKPVQQLLDKMELGMSKVLILVPELDENIALATRNIPNVIAMPAREANTYTVVSAEYVLIVKSAIPALEEVLG